MNNTIYQRITDLFLNDNETLNNVSEIVLNDYQVSIDEIGKVLKV